jgi:hypothetical protein
VAGGSKFIRDSILFKFNSEDNAGMLEWVEIRWSETGWSFHYYLLWFIIYYYYFMLILILLLIWCKFDCYLWFIPVFSLSRHLRWHLQCIQGRSAWTVQCVDPVWVAVSQVSVLQCAILHDCGLLWLSGELHCTVATGEGQYWVWLFDFLR